MRIQYIADWSDVDKLRGWILIPAGCQIDLSHHFVLSTFQQRFFPPQVVAEVQGEVSDILQMTGLLRYGIIDFPLWRLGLFQIGYDYNHEVNVNLARFSLEVLKEWFQFRNVQEVGIIVPEELLWLFTLLADVLPDNITLVMLNSSKEGIEQWTQTVKLEVEHIPGKKSHFGQRSLSHFFSF